MLPSLQSELEAEVVVAGSDPGDDGRDDGRDARVTARTLRIDSTRPRPPLTRVLETPPAPTSDQPSLASPAEVAPVGLTSASWAPPRQAPPEAESCGRAAPAEAEASAALRWSVSDTRACSHARSSSSTIAWTCAAVITSGKCTPAVKSAATSTAAAAAAAAAATATAAAASGVDSTLALAAAAAEMRAGEVAAVFSATSPTTVDCWAGTGAGAVASPSTAARDDPRPTAGPTPSFPSAGGATATTATSAAPLRVSRSAVRAWARGDAGGVILAVVSRASTARGVAAETEAFLECFLDRCLWCPCAADVALFGAAAAAAVSAFAPAPNRAWCSLRSRSNAAS